MYIAKPRAPGFSSFFEIATQIEGSEEVQMLGLRSKPCIPFNNGMWFVQLVLLFQCSVRYCVGGTGGVEVMSEDCKSADSLPQNSKHSCGSFRIFSECLIRLKLGSCAGCTFRRNIITSSQRHFTHNLLHSTTTSPQPPFPITIILLRSRSCYRGEAICRATCHSVSFLTSLRLKIHPCFCQHQYHHAT